MNEDEKYKEAYEQWDRKTWWMNEKGAIPTKYLGMHKADVLKAMLDEQREIIEKIANWPDGGSEYGQEKIKRFCAKYFGIEK